MAESNYNINLDPIKKLAPTAEHNTGYMNATQLGEKLGISARTVNKWLADNGYQIKDGKDWRLTEKGKQYAEETPYVNNGHIGYQIRWSEDAIKLFGGETDSGQNKQNFLEEVKKSKTPTPKGEGL